MLEEEEEGWWRGRVGNHEGVFPSNFVEEILEEEPPKPEPPRHATPEPPPPVDSQTGERREFNTRLSALLSTFTKCSWAQLVYVVPQSVLAYF